MLGKERILATLAGEKADRVPFTPNFWMWYYANEFKGTLSPQISDCKHPVEILRRMGADILLRFENKVHAIEYPGCAYNVWFDGDDLGRDVLWAGFTSFERTDQRHESIGTPYGTLTHLWKYARDTGAPFEEDHWWKDWSEYAAVRYWLEHTTMHLDPAALQHALALLGDDGPLHAVIPETPLKRLHWLAGQVNASYFIMDHPQEMMELVRIHERMGLAYLEEIVDQPDIHMFETSDQVDSLFYTPSWFRELCMPYLSKAAQMVHARGKYLFVHSCGRLKGLAPLFVEAGVDCMEGQPPPPVGDLYLHEARDISRELIIAGGMAPQEQILTGPTAGAQIDAYTRDLFASMGDKRRFIFSSSCTTSPLCPYENLLAFRDAGLRYGQLS